MPTSIKLLLKTYYDYFYILEKTQAFTPYEKYDHR